MSKKRLHGEHNQKLSDILFKGKKFYDWSVTTAFYSAIHFVEAKILPCKVSGLDCKNIYDVKKAYGMSGRHSSRERLVFDNLPTEIAVKYKWLDDKSRYSRYTTFKVTVTEADKSQQYLKSIYEECFVD